MRSSARRQPLRGSPRSESSIKQIPFSPVTTSTKPGGISSSRSPRSWISCLGPRTPTDLRLGPSVNNSMNAPVGAEATRRSRGASLGCGRQAAVDEIKALVTERPLSELSPPRDGAFNHAPSAEGSLAGPPGSVRVPMRRYPLGTDVRALRRFCGKLLAVALRRGCLRTRPIPLRTSSSPLGRGFFAVPAQDGRVQLSRPLG
jgi:hypothetical protein